MTSPHGAVSAHAASSVGLLSRTKLFPVNHPALLNSSSIGRLWHKQNASGPKHEQFAFSALDKTLTALFQVIVEASGRISS
jgi:hypothetical protein